MSVRFMMGVAIGAVGGYAVGRAIEARAHGVPLNVAFSRVGVSIMELSRQLHRASQASAGVARRVRAGAAAALDDSDVIDAEFQEA